MNTCLLEVSESLPMERRHTISQSVSNSQVNAYFRQMQVAACMYPVSSGNY